MKNPKQQKVETLVNEVLKEFQGEPSWKFAALIKFLEKVNLENSTINTDLENVWKNYSPDSFIFFSNSDNKD